MDAAATDPNPAKNMEFNDKPRKELQPFRVIRCPANGLQVSWCRGLCQPMDGIGMCGRRAPHALIDRTQRAIAAFESRKLRKAQ